MRAGLLALLLQAPVLSRTVALADWDIPDIAHVRSGRVGAILDPAGARLEVYALRNAVVGAPPFVVRRETPERLLPGGTFLIADFASGNRNRLGGYFNVFQRAPSEATADLAAGADGRRALRFRFTKQGAGFVGFWVHLFDFTSPPEARRYLDARPFTTLSFWVRGDRGGEQLLLKVADAAWERREDALPVLDVPVDTVWRQVIVPLDRVPAGIDRSALASFSFEARSPGRGMVYLSTVALSVDPKAAPRLAPLEGPTPSHAGPRATWIWHTTELLDRPEEQRPLLAFLESTGIDRVFLQVPADLDQEALRLRPLVAALHAAGMRAYALDGDRRYALPAFHPLVLAGVDAVIRYNRASPAGARFDGLRHDIEPYLLPGFSGPHRTTILRGLLTLVAQCAQRAHAAGLEYGLDIPFWYDAPDEDTFQRVIVEFAGAAKPASQHFIDLADDVTVMDYRTSAYGADGTIRHAEDELGYAAALGKRVYVGLETVPLPDEELVDFAGPPRAGPPPDRAQVLALVPRGDSVEVRLGPGTGLPPSAAWWPVQRRLRVPGDRLSFARLGAGRLGETMQGTLAELGRYPSFAGFAIHDARGFQRLRDR